MSEAFTPQPESDPQLAERQRAFKVVYAHATGLAAKHGQPIEVRGAYGPHLSSVGKYSNMPLEENARRARINVEEEGEEFKGWIDGLSEDAATKVHEVARVRIDRKDSDHSFDIFSLKPDGITIKHTHVGEEHDGIDERGDPINWRETVEDLGSLDPQQMEHLQQVLETAQPLST